MKRQRRNFNQSPSSLLDEIIERHKAESKEVEDSLQVFRLDRFQFTQHNRTMYMQINSLLTKRDAQRISIGELVTKLGVYHLCGYLAWFSSKSQNPRWDFTPVQ